MKVEVFTENDYDYLLKWIDSEQVLHQWASPAYAYPVTKAQLIEANQQLIDKRLYYKGSVHDEVVAYGEIGFIDEVNQAARLCRILVDNQKRGQGLGKLWMKSLVELGFLELGLNRIELGVFDYNQAAIKCYQSIGFCIEGLLREQFKANNTFWSIYRMSILRSEWINKKAANSYDNQVLSE